MGWRTLTALDHVADGRVLLDAEQASHGAHGRVAAAVADHGEGPVDGLEEVDEAGGEDDDLGQPVGSGQGSAEVGSGQELLHSHDSRRDVGELCVGAGLVELTLRGFACGLLSVACSLELCG